MPYKLKKDHVTNWDAHNFNNQSTFSDEQDSYISERSSIPSLNDNTLSSRSNTKQLPIIPRKEPHKLRYAYNELPENGVPLAIQVNNARKEEKKRQKAVRKAPPGQGTLAPIVEAQPPEMGDHYYPYWYYYKMKNPDWVMRHRQTNNGQLLPYETVDPSQYVHKPAASDAPTNPRRQRQKSRRHQGPPTIRYNHEKQQYEPISKDPEEHRSDARQYIPLNDGERRSIHRRKLKTETDWNDHYLQSMTSKGSKESGDITTIPGTSRRRSHHHHRHQSSLPDIRKDRHHLSSHSERSHHHDQDYFPTKEYVDSEFQVVDASFKKSERTSYFQQTSDPYPSSPPAIYNQSSYLPLLVQEYYPRLNPTDLPNIHTFSRDWNDPSKAPKVYKPDAQTKFYDHYLNDVIDKRLTT